MTGSSDLKAELEREHKEIYSALRGLERVREPQALQALFEELDPLLQRHFKREEAAGGLHASIGETAVNLVPQVQDMMVEHGEICGTIRTLHDRCEQLALLEEQVHGETVALVERLRRHEERESELAAKAVYTEHGVGD